MPVLLREPHRPHHFRVIYVACAHARPGAHVHMQAYMTTETATEVPKEERRARKSRKIQGMHARVTEQAVRDHIATVLSLIHI